MYIIFNFFSIKSLNEKFQKTGKTLTDFGIVFDENDMIDARFIKIKFSEIENPDMDLVITENFFVFVSSSNEALYIKKLPPFLQYRILPEITDVQICFIII